MGLGNTASVGGTSLAEVRIYNVVAGTVCGAPGVLVAHVSEGRVGQVILTT